MTTGLEGFGGTDMVVPTYKLFQATSSDVPGIDKELAVGDYFDAAGKFNRKKGFKAVLLAATKKRMLYWDEKKDGVGKKGRRCWSDDGVVPASNVQYPVNTRCNMCEYRNQDEEFHMTLLDVEQSLENGTPSVFKYVAKGTSLFPTRTLISALVKSQKPARDFVFVLGSERKANKQGKGNFAIATYTSVMPIDSEGELLSALAEEAYQLYVGTTPNPDESAVVTDEEAAAAEQF